MRTLFYNNLLLPILLHLTLAAPAKRDTVVADSTQSAISLKQAYKNYFPIGTAIDPDFFTNPAKADFLVRQYSSLTPENQMKPRALQPSENVWTFDGADKIVNFASEHNMKVRGHTLIWFYRMPAWFYKNDNALVSKDLLYKRMETHINTIVKRYAGKVYCWDVVNEAISSKDNLPNQIFNPADTLYKIAGEEYIDKAFQLARKADPNALLYYNDAFYTKEKRDKIYGLLKRLKQRNVPIDGVGIQCHFGIEGISESLLRESIKMFAALGLKVQITEIDVSIFKKVTKPVELLNVDDTYTSALQQKQMDVYDMVFKVCRENKNIVTGVTFWGAADLPNYFTRTFKKRNYPYMFDSNLKPKKVLFSITKF